MFLDHENDVVNTLQKLRHYKVGYRTLHGSWKESNKIACVQQDCICPDFVIQRFTILLHCEVTELRVVLARSRATRRTATNQRHTLRAPNYL